MNDTDKSPANKLAAGIVAVASAVVLVAACSPKAEAGAKQQNLRDDAQAALNDMQRQDPSLRRFLESSEGYVVFPNVGKGGFVVGGAYGRGVVYERGAPIGYADLTAGSVGLQAGGETYGELIAFENTRALDEFRQGGLRFAANASAVALTSGVAATTPYSNGVAVFIRPKGGLMAEASVGGQSFRFIPSDEAER